MRHTPNLDKVEDELFQFFDSQVVSLYKQQNWTKDSKWTDGIHAGLAEIGHRYGFKVFASNSRCPASDGPEWLYDHHWRITTDDDLLIRIPLVLEIEWGYGSKTIHQKITEDFLKLVQARADLRVMVFQCSDIAAETEKLISMAETFEGTQQGDRWIFAGWGWDTSQMHCRRWIA